VLATLLATYERPVVAHHEEVTLGMLGAREAVLDEERMEIEDKANWNAKQ